MATYYKYAERNVDSFINWAEIGKNITDTLQEENKLREQKKAAIDENSRKLGQQLAEAPTGQSQKMNEWTLKYADQAQKARLLQDKLLKAGRLNPKDYTVQRQNLSDGTNSLFKLSKEYQDEFARKMQRMNDADPNKRSQALESYLMGTVEGFGNFNESEALINPTDYTVNVSMMKQNPKTGMYEPTGDIATVNSLRNRIKGEFNYFNVENANRGIAGKLAEYITAEIKRGSASRAGMVITTEDAMKRPGYQKALDDAIQSFLVNEYNISSILTNDIGTDPKTGKPFSFTFNADEAKKDKNLILLETKNDMPVPKFTEDQKKAAALFMKGQIEQMIKHDEKINPYAEPRPERPSEYFYKRADELKDQQTAVSAWNSVFTGLTAEEKKIAADQLMGTQRAQKAGLIDIDFNAQAVDEEGKEIPDAKGVKLIYLQPEKNRTISYVPGKTKLGEWAKVGNELHGVDDITTAMKYSGGGDPNLVMGTKYTNFGGVRSSRQGPTAEVGGMTPQQKSDMMKLQMAKEAKELGYKFDWNTGTVIQK